MPGMWNRALDWVDGKKAVAEVVSSCPLCFGEVDPRATVCRHCAREITPTTSMAVAEQSVQQSQRRPIRIFGAVCWGIVAILISPSFPGGGNPFAAFLGVLAIGLGIRAKSTLNSKMAKAAFWVGLAPFLSFLGAYGTQCQRIGGC